MKSLLSSALLVFFAACSGAPPEAPVSPGPETAATVAPPSSETPDPPAQPAACVPAPDRLCPVDEGASDPSFAAYRTRLEVAVRRRDADALLALVDPDIRTSFGGTGGIDHFRAQWKLDAPDSALWPELDAILSSGGTFRGPAAARSFWAPYVYSAWPEGKDSFTHVAALGPDVEVRESASASALTSRLPASFRASRCTSRWRPASRPSTP